MTECYDVVVVGARCAGATLAFHLARAGLSVALVDRTHFPSDTLSTHFLETPGVAALDRMGVLDEMTATGAPFIYTVDYRLGDVAGVGPYGSEDEELQGPGWCVRRTVLDAALVRAADAAGATVRTGCRVTGVTSAGERVTGVVVLDEAGREIQLEAAIVAGADGAGSTVARMVGARRYHVLANQRFAYWGYFDGASEPGPPALFFHRTNDDMLYVGAACDDGLYMALVMPALDQISVYSDGLDTAFGASVASCEPFAAILAGARRVGPLRGMASYPLFFRESAGPGWVLLGDAGHFKDPAAGQGISDAFRQAERLADDIVQGLGSGTSDEALAAWWRWRDARELELHWLAADMGAAGPVPVLLSEVVRDLQASPRGLLDFWGIFHRRTTASEVLTPDRLGAAAARLAGTPLEPQAQAELAVMVEMAEARAKLAQSPVYENDGSRIAAARTG